MVPVFQSAKPFQFGNDIASVPESFDIEQNSNGNTRDIRTM
jgi:hypothetical protein